MSTPTTQAAGTPAASAAANTVVASSATTRSSSAPTTSVVTSTVTTSSSPKRTMSLGEYEKARGNTTFDRDVFQALFGADRDADMKDGEEDEETSSSTFGTSRVKTRFPRLHTRGSKCGIAP
ncbi:unnamed protein product [Phytophthora fragariaefolia]|uniref:Unnamed protein product n=1 Tax=Phytophthora fragariaefolia TaxID=1490495 RepID=A0A9W6YC87_9STRA|nr:unnamed protein product [Phytophthora fragariaefolia]